MNLFLILGCVGCLIAIIVIVIAIVMMTKPKESFEGSSTPIPKLIWTYWHDENDIPPIVDKCIETWRRHNPDYRITILNDRMVSELCGGFQISDLNLPPKFHQRHSDFARILIVKTYGGVWMDSSIICTQSLQWIQDAYAKKAYDLLGYFAPSNLTTSKEFPILENWFFAAPMGSLFIQDWWNEALFMNSFGSETDYVKYIKDQNRYDLQQLESQLPYLVMHLCAMVVQQRDSHRYNLILMDSETGPYEYLVKNGWEHDKSFAELCSDPVLNESPILKLRGNERWFLEQNDVPCELGGFNEDVHGVVRWRGTS